MTTRRSSAQPVRLKFSDLGIDRGEAYRARMLLRLAKKTFEECLRLGHESTVLAGMDTRCGVSRKRAKNSQQNLRRSALTQLERRLTYVIGQIRKFFKMVADSPDTLDLARGRGTILAAKTGAANMNRAHSRICAYRVDDPTMDRPGSEEPSTQRKEKHSPSHMRLKPRQKKPRYIFEISTRGTYD